MTSDVQQLRLKAFPVAGILGEDLFMNNYFDHDPSAGAIDYMGGTKAANGHYAYDINIRTFTEMDLGVPVFAACEGTVVAIEDGNYDRWGEQQAPPAGARPNIVILQHDVCSTSYTHLRNGSVIVSVGQQVLAGQQIGEIGSSGNSTWPHLHFSCVENGVEIDPFSGPRNPVPSRWDHQPEYSYPYKVVDGGYMQNSPAGPPAANQRKPFLRVGDAGLQCWFIELNGGNLTASTRLWELYDPAGQLRKNWLHEIVNPVGNLGRPWWWISDVALSPGIWTTRLWHDSHLEAELRVHVAGANDAAPPNGAPIRPVARLAKDGPWPTGIVTCQVLSPLLGQDENLDLVRYRYEWYVDGAQKRACMSVARSDCFALESFGQSTILACRVSAGDGLNSYPQSRGAKMGKL